MAQADRRHIDAWLEAGTTTLFSARMFVSWATANQHARGIEIPSHRGDHPTTPVADETRWALIRQLLHDGELALADRVAGLLVLLYAQPTTAIARITATQITRAGETVRLCLGDTPIDLLQPLAGLVTELLATRHSYSVIGHEASAWLFPGSHADRHISEYRLRSRLKRLGIYAQPARTAALRDLAGQLPATVLARLLGVNIETATRWQHDTNTAWTGYATEVTRR